MKFVVTYPSGKTWTVEHMPNDEHADNHDWYAQNLGWTYSLTVLKELHAALEYGCVISTKEFEPI